MRILLINPCYQHPLRRYHGGVIKVVPAPPLGLASIAAVLREHGRDVCILDMVARDLRPQHLAEALDGLSPQVIGISCNMAFVHTTAQQVARALRELFPSARIIFGGSHASFVPDQLMRECPAIDAIVRGEGERTFLKVVNKLEACQSLTGILGLQLRNPETGQTHATGTAPRIDDLDQLPLPARDLLPMDLYPAGAAGTRGLIMTSRGCPFSCAYCSTSRFHGNRVRFHGVARILEELRTICEDHGAAFASFADDTFTMNRQRVECFCRELIARGSPYAWGCDTRVDLVDARLLQLMSDAGCEVIFYGIESATQRVIDNMGKGFRLEQARQAISETRAAGIEAQVSFIIGLPGETYAGAQRMADFVDETGADGVLYNILIAYPGSRIHQDPKHFGVESFSDDWGRCEQVRPMTRTGAMSEDEIRRAWIYLITHLQERERRRTTPRPALIEGWQ